jgi:hypothetical protein
LVGAPFRVGQLVCSICVYVLVDAGL